MLFNFVSGTLLKPQTGSQSFVLYIFTRLCHDGCFQASKILRNANNLWVLVPVECVLVSSWVNPVHLSCLTYWTVRITVPAHLRCFLYGLHAGLLIWTMIHCEYSVSDRKHSVVLSLFNGPESLGNWFGLWARSPSFLFRVNSRENSALFWIVTSSSALTDLTVYLSIYALHLFIHFKSCLTHL